MARENQGLQIAVIVFVMLTIILGVLSFMFSKEYGKQKALAADAEKKALEANTALSQAESENMRLKVILGHPETATLQSIDERFATDKETYAKNFNNADPNYLTMCQWLFDELQQKNLALATETKRVQDVKDHSASLEAAKEQQIKALSDRATKAETDLAAKTAEFNQAQAALANINSQLQADKAKTEKEKQTVAAQAQTAQDNYKKDKQKDLAYIKELQTQIDEMDPIVVDYPDGVVTYAGRGNTVSIDLGRADGLERLMNFAVYARDMTDVTSAGRKGAIEVIDLDDHSAVAQIVDEDVSNPILAGDKIFTPLWSPGEKQHFALTDGMDIDGDKRSDVDEVRNLITSNGGIVDFWLDDEGNKFGQISVNTVFLVEGSAPDESSSTARLGARKFVLEEAAKRNLRKISLADLLTRMGYKRQVHVVRYDAKANPSDFRPQPPEGVPQVSDGHVSDRYERRIPLKPAVDSAY